MLLATLVMAPPAPGQQREEVLTNADIVALTEAGVPAEAILIKIESTRSDFDTSVEQLIALSRAGVDASVVAAMTKKSATEAPTAAAEPEPASQPQPVTEPSAPAEAAVQPSTDPPPAPEPAAPAAPEPPQRAASAQPQDEAAPSVLPPVAVAPFQPGSTFADALALGGSGPEMVVIPAGRFRMGCVTRSGCFPDERPVHRVFFDEPIAVSRYAVTFEDYDRFAGSNRPADEGWGRERRPVINVSWDDAVRYAQWLSRETGENYRLLSEAEWEYAARAGSERKYHFGNDSTQLCRYANHADAETDYEWRNSYCSDGVGKKTAIVGSYLPNAFGLYDMHGNVWEWVQDCWNDHYRRAPRDGAARLEGDCSMRVLRGGAFGYEPESQRAAFRTPLSSRGRSNDIGFRVARTLTP